jgi:ligand-binding sensor domain-containing protein
VLPRVCKTLSCLPLLFCISCSCAQDFIYKHYDLQDGLASLTIHSIFQDRDGFLWFGTESGLCRYDGTRFKTFTIKDGLPGNEVFDMLQDRKGRIWMYLYKNSVAYIYNGKIYNQQNDTLLRKIQLTSRVYGITEDGEGNIILCDHNAIYIISENNRTVKRIYPKGSIPYNLIGLYTDHNGKLIICDNRALYKIADDRAQYIKTIAASGQKIGPTQVLLRPDYVVYWPGKEEHLIYLSDTVICLKLSVNNVFKYSSLSDSLFSINSSEGAFLFNINNFGVTKVLPGIKATNIFNDREKNLWIGTESRGVYKISSQVIVNKKVNNDRNDIYYITKNNARIIAANSSTEVYEFNNNDLTSKNIHNSNGVFRGKIFYYEQLNERTYLLAHSNGLLYDDGLHKKGLYKVMLKQVNSIDNDRVLTAVNDGIYIVEKKGLKIVDTVWRRKSLAALQINDTILAGTLTGLFMLKKEGARYIIADSLLQTSIIAYIGKTDNNLIWVCTYEDGLYCIGNGKIIRHFDDMSGLSSNNGRSLFVQGNTVWLGTDKGMVKITPLEGSYRIQKYSTSDGLPSDIINSIYVDGDMIYVGTPEGLCCFNEKMIETTSICNLVLTSVSIGDSLVDVSDKYVLRRTQRFAVEYSGISLRSEKEMVYRYKINGIDDDWRHTTLGALEFTSLPYGEYQLEIIAVNKFGKESQPLKIQFDVIKPFYKETWFIIPLILLPVSIVILYWSRRVSMKRQRQVQKFQQEIKILQLEQMAMRAQMNPHFIFNCISTMQQLIAGNEKDNATRFTNSFANLVRQTLDNAPELLIPLGEEIRFLHSYFELEQIKLEDRFDYVIDTTGIKNIDLLWVPNMVIQPFVENAIRHGIRYKKNGPGRIEVAFTQKNALLRCTITDNGIGREKAAQLQKEAAMNHASRAMDITAKRISALNALTNGKISIVIEDMRDADHHASGTKVIIDFYGINDHYDKNGYH